MTSEKNNLCSYVFVMKLFGHEIPRRVELFSLPTVWLIYYFWCVARSDPSLPCSCKFSNNIYGHGVHIQTYLETKSNCAKYRAYLHIEFGLFF